MSRVGGGMEETADAQRGKSMGFNLASYAAYAIYIKTFIAALLLEITIVINTNSRPSFPP